MFQCLAAVALVLLFGTVPIIAWHLCLLFARDEMIINKTKMYNNVFGQCFKSLYVVIKVGTRVLCILLVDVLGYVVFNKFYFICKLH